MTNVILIGIHNNRKIAECILNNFNVIAGIVDKKASNQEFQKSFFKENNIKEVSFEEAMQMSPDLYLILIFNSLIDEKYLKNKKILNLHGGLLPKYRGRSGNLIAILNNEEFVGYTLHLIDEGMDSGDIISTFKVKNDINLTAEELIAQINEKIIKELPETIKKYVNGEITPESQAGKPYIYTTSLRPENGIITDWNIDSMYLYNLFRIYGGKNGSGLYFYHKDKKYRIRKMSLCGEISPYIGIPGVVTCIKNNSVFVKTKDTCISIDEITLDDIIIENLFKIGVRL